MGGGRYSNCSIIEALDLVENITNIKIKRKIIKKKELVIIFGIFQIYLNLKNITQIGNKNTILKKL